MLCPNFACLSWCRLPNCSFKLFLYLLIVSTYCFRPGCQHSPQLQNWQRVCSAIPCSRTINCPLSPKLPLAACTEVFESSSVFKGNRVYKGPIRNLRPFEIRHIYSLNKYGQGRSMQTNDEWGKRGYSTPFQNADFGVKEMLFHIP